MDDASSGIDESRSRREARASIDGTERLDAHLVRGGWARSRRHARELIAAGRVTVNAHYLSKGGMLRAGDQVNVIDQPPQAILSPNAEITIEVLFADPSVLVVNKPGLLPCHPLGSDERATVINALVAAYPEVATAGDKVLEGGLVHRLDNGTSGALLIARTPAAFVALRAALKQGQISRSYLALCRGRLKRKLKITTPLAHHPSNRRKMVTVPGGASASTDHKARPAVTFVAPVRIYRDFTLVEARPLTGSRHQIRLHLASRGYPLAGDPLYGGPSIAELKPGRFWLHLRTLVFETAGNQATVKAPLAPELETALRRLD